MAIRVSRRRRSGDVGAGSKEENFVLVEAGWLKAGQPPPPTLASVPKVNMLIIMGGWLARVIITIIVAAAAR